MARYHLDASNLFCPMPVIRTQDRVADLSPGDELRVVATDPGALQDIPAWCRVSGHRVVEARSEGREVVVVLAVGGTGA